LPNGQCRHAIGNHTYSHRNLGSAPVSVEDFEADVLREQALFDGLPTWRKRLRFPYLKEGETVIKRDGMREWMRANGYLPAPVSIDASDWYYNERFLKLPQGDAEKISAFRACTLLIFGTVRISTNPLLRKSWGVVQST